MEAEVIIDMSWNEVLGHDAILERFRGSVAAGRLASTFLFVGPAGIGKRTFALKLAQALLCETNPETLLEPCGKCPQCQQVAARTHPDLSLIERPADKSFIPLELLIGDDEHRMREGLCHEISLKPFRGGRKIAIIDDADYLNQEGANCLLKTLEEPPPKSVIILIGTSEQRQLPTIRSRSQIVRFQPLSREVVQQLLLRNELVETEQEASELADLSDGSLEQAAELLEPSVREFRQQWLQFLAVPADNTFSFAKDLSTFIDAAGKEAPPRRARMKQVARWGADFYRALMARLAGRTESADPALEKSLAAAVRRFPDPESAANGLERCLDAHNQIEANANQATLIECWLDDLANLSTAVK
jgi:DNA polymerase-3 subunit delta'